MTTPSLLDDVIADVMPETAGQSSRRRNRKILVRLSWVALSSLIVFTVSKGADWLTAEHDTQVSNDADNKVDREGPAFSANVRLSTQYPEATLFNTPFTTEEKNQILGQPRDLGSFTKNHHGRGVYYGNIWFPGVKFHGYSEEWLVDLISDRKASLVINGLKVKGLKCTPAKANTVIVTVEEGAGSYEGMLFDLSASTDSPLITGDEEEHFREPFFAYKKIDLGNGATPGGLRIQVTSGTKDCTWKSFEATYIDSDGTHTQDITNNGKGFAVHGISEHPKQIFVHSIKGLAECTPLDLGKYKC